MRVGARPLSVVLLCSAILTWVPAAPVRGRGPIPGGPELGVYEPCPDPWECDVRATLTRLREAGFNAVLVTAVGYDGALYNSAYLPRVDWAPEGYLREVVREARSLGMRVYAWVNVPHGVWLSEHPDWIAVYSDGRPADHYSDDYFHSIVPPSRVVREPECLGTLRGVARELAEMGFDGVDLNDNFQFSDYYFEDEDRTLYTSYDRFTVSAFENDTGVEVPGSGPAEWAEAIESDPDLWNLWVGWRAEQVTRLVGEVADAVHEVNPEVEVRPHLLIWWPLETYGEDYHALAREAGTLYVMVSADDWRTHVTAVRRALRAGASKVVASTYLLGLNGTADPGLLLRRRARWLASAGADGLFVFNYELMERERLWDQVEAALAEFERTWRLKRYGGYPAWLTGATVVSVYAEPGRDRSGAAASIGRAMDQGASVIELDIGMSRADEMYDDGRFREVVAWVRNLSRLVHSRGGRVVVYVPGLEVNWKTPDYPLPDRARDWLQLSLGGRPVAASGGEVGVPWLEPDEWTGWMSPFSPHRDVVVDRVARLISEGEADGVWLDVPFMPTWLSEEKSYLWPDASRWGARDFEEWYWEDPPEGANLSDPAFRDWLDWRRWAVADFVSAVADSAWEAGGVLIVESSTCDWGITELGYDSALFRGDPRVLLVAEVDAPEGGFEFGDLDNWTAFLASLKYVEAAGGEKPTWFLNYGSTEDEAARQLGLILATSGSFFETNNDGFMVGTVGPEFRERAFRLVSLLRGTGEDGAEVGVIFSSRSLDLTGEAWGPYAPGESRHLRAFREVVRELALAGIQFDVVPIEYVAPADLERYETLVAPDVEVLDREARLALSEFNGTLLRVGELGVMDEWGWDADPLDVGEEASPGGLVGALSNLSWEVTAPRGVLIDAGSAGACRFYSVVNVGARVVGRDESISVPPGSWVVDFDSQSLWISDGEEEVPKTFYLVIQPPPGSPAGSGPSGVEGARFWVPSEVDLEMNPEIAGRAGRDPDLAGTVVAVGGPAVDPSAWIGSMAEFVSVGGAYRALRFGNETYPASFGDEDYAVIWVQSCGNLTLIRVAGITRYGTRAGILWLLGAGGRGGIPPGYALLRWSDSDGDGYVDPGEVEALAVSTSS